MPDTPSTTDPTAIEWYVEAIGEDEDFAKRSEYEAKELVYEFIGGEANPYGVPKSSIERAVLEVGADLFYRRLARNGITTFDGVDVEPVRLNRNPMSAAYPILRPHLVSGL